jgi:hypothetical protein
MSKKKLHAVALETKKYLFTTYLKRKNKDALLHTVTSKIFCANSVVRLVYTLLGSINMFISTF